ncbi:serine/threonine protein kinase [Thermocatellispora tengchongensis]|uniref:non-specific serine/threonine protein kinase n=1 Tax=Thermocatellispora tengchongensis TaxID=1073253 RepID=A0A840P4Z2_9ACTN|nr:NERD domain-containing protein kinase family protein [Thermocatellispora tengchongensis]MBB5132973.1 serine/threonine protein kinase [Thermocatellispora tengchongensis]
MAQIVGGGHPVNDAERRVIAHLRDHAPDDWLLLHNIEVPRGEEIFEVDLIVITGHSVCVIDVKGTHGRIEVAGTRWFPPRQGAYGSPVAKVRGTARALKGLMVDQRRELERVYVDSLVVLTAPDAVLVDPAGRDSRNVTALDRLLTVLGDVSRVRRGCSPDARPYLTSIVEALNGAVRRSTAPPRYGNWQVEEQLGGDSRVTEYRAVNATLGGGETVLLRVYQADPLAVRKERDAERERIANAYRSLTGIPAHPCVVRSRDFFAIDDESRFVLVLDDVHGRALHLYLGSERRDGDPLDLVEDVLRGLAHVHGNGVLHRALSPATVLVTEDGRAMLTGFDHAKPGPRDFTVANELPGLLDVHYVAPECQARPELASFASDVYAAGVIAHQLLTGELPDPALPDAGPPGTGGPAEIMDLVRRMRAQDPAKRPTAAEALDALLRARAAPPPVPAPPAAAPPTAVPPSTPPPPFAAPPQEPRRADGGRRDRALFDRLRAGLRRHGR